MKSPNDILAYNVANAIPADSIARAIAYAIEQPADVEIDEVVIRADGTGFPRR